MNIIPRSGIITLFYWLLVIEAQETTKPKVGLPAEGVLVPPYNKPVYSVSAESSAECGDICLLLAHCEQFQFLVVGDAAVSVLDNPQAKASSPDATDDHKWNCLIFDNTRQQSDTVMVQRHFFEKSRCSCVTESLQSGQGVLMKYLNRYLFLGERFDETSAWKKQHGSLLTRSTNGAMRFLGRDICLGWRFLTRDMQFLILVLETCVEDTDYVYKYTNITKFQSSPGNNGCKWAMP